MRITVKSASAFSISVLVFFGPCADAQQPVVTQAPPVLATLKNGWKRSRPLMFPAVKVQFPSIASWV